LVSAASPKIAVLLPCFNEEAAIAATVAGFRAALPDATVYVYDNNSADRTRDLAARAGAVVRTETQQGKGHVVRRMFADVDADLYVMADGDLTYDPAAAPAMVDLLLRESLDMVVGTRRHEQKHAYRGGHVLGNRIFTGLLAGLFGRSFKDIFSGYRVFSRRFVKSFPVLSEGFEIETEMSVHALELRMPVGEVETAYAARLEGSHSKLSTFGDGGRILRTIVTLYRIERPFLFFGTIGALLFIAALLLSIPLVRTYLHTGLVPRIPTAILVTGMTIIAVLCVFAGLILDTVTRGRREVRRLAYLSFSAPAFAGAGGRLEAGGGAPPSRLRRATSRRKRGEKSRA
jgi:glycosyltransferase involved in cell wall biosynthesis